MSPKHPKTVRRELLLFLYERYQLDPLEMLGPEEFLHESGWTKKELIPNMHYLNDRKLVELMFGYHPPLFSAVRILAAGVDLVENPFEFKRLFPAQPQEEDEQHGRLMYLVEQLVDEVDFAPIEGTARKNQLRDAQYLRDEVAQPIRYWRIATIEALLDWIEKPLEAADHELAVITNIRDLITKLSKE